MGWNGSHFGNFANGVRRPDRQPAADFVKGSLVPYCFFTGSKLSPSAGPGFHKAGRIGKMLFSAEPCKAGELSPCDGKQTKEAKQGAKRDGLQAVAVFMDTDLRCILYFVIWSEQKQPKAQAAACIPPGVDAAAVLPVRIAASQPEKKDAANQRRQKSPGALQKKKAELFQNHRILSVGALEIKRRSTGLLHRSALRLSVRHF